MNSAPREFVGVWQIQRDEVLKNMIFFVSGFFIKLWCAERERTQKGIDF